MPQGKGTYGSKVGRPSKKQEGGMIDPFSAKNQEGVLVQEALETIGEQGEQSEFPTTNAMERSESYQLGGAVQPPRAGSITPTPQYDKGGKVGNVKGEKVDVTDVVRKVSQREKLKKMHKGKAGRKGSNLKKQARRMAREVIGQSEWPGEDWGKEKKK